ncbi:hypothetical protein PINS_up005145 [Pythium insidiosum]|nr:hypothetical protein PINS_up005145 [Pythium insidiosum]
MNASHSGLIVQIGYLEAMANDVMDRASNTKPLGETAGKNVQAAHHVRGSATDEPNDKVVARCRVRRAVISPSKHKRIAAGNTDKGLTFLQSARKQNIPVRSGKWNVQEENYLRKLVQLFSAGVLDEVEQKTSMRSWLSRMLNCCPMRISKKQMHGEKFKGKVKFQKDIDRIERMSQNEYDRMCLDVQRLRTSFLKHWAKEEFGRWNVEDRALGFDEWYNNVIATVPSPRVAKNNRLVEPAPLKQAEGWTRVKEQIEALRQRSRASISQCALSTEPRLRPLQMKRIRSGSNDGSQNATPKKQVKTTKTPCCSLAHCSDAPVSLTPSVSDASTAINNDVTVNEGADFVESTMEPISWLSDINTEQVQASASLAAKSLESLFCDESLTPRHSERLVLDFGPPSVWDTEEDKTTYFHETMNWDEDLFLDDTLFELDQATLAPYDVPLEAWYPGSLVSTSATLPW